MIMACIFCYVNFEFNTIKYNTVINIHNKTINVFSDFPINELYVNKDNKKII